MKMTAEIPSPLCPAAKPVGGRRFCQVQEEAGGASEAVCAILLASCLIFAFGQCVAQIVL